MTLYVILLYLRTPSVNEGQFNMAAERKNIWSALALFSLVLILSHLIASFCARKVIGSYLLTIGIYGLAFWMICAVSSGIVRHAGIRRSLQWVTGILVTLFFLHDTALRFAPVKDDLRTYTEKNTGGFLYFSNYTFHNIWTNAMRFHRTPNSVRHDAKPEYRYRYSYNQLGWRSHGEEVLPADPADINILALGDSWTESVGAPDSLTWTFLLQQNLRRRYGDRYNVINAGMSGNDPFLEFRVLRKFCDMLMPDHVLLALNSSDVIDVINRGGAERFTGSGRLKGRCGPWWEFFYSGSFVLRKHLHNSMHLTKSLQSQSGTEAAYRTAVDQITGQLMEINAYCGAREIDFKVAVLLHQYDFRHGRSDHHLDIIAENAAREGIFVIELRDCFESVIDRSRNIHKYWWELDYHHTPLGYSLLADCLTPYF